MRSEANLALEGDAREGLAAAPGMKLRVKTLAGDVLVWLLLCVLLAMGFANARAVAELYPPISLRYDTPISGQTAYNARKYAIENGKENSQEKPFWPTFWRQETAAFSNDLAKVTADSIAYSGEAALVWPGDYLFGTAPGVVDGMGCALSDGLARQLWGSADVVGRTVEVHGEERIVRGVFAEERELALLSYQDGDTSQSWSAAELSGGPADATRSDVETFATASGLGKPSSILMGEGPKFLAGFGAALPLLMVAGYGLYLMVRMLRKGFVGMRKLFPYALLFGLAIFLPLFLNGLSPWLVPTKWSDFSFWSSLQLGDSLREFFGVMPQLRDVEGHLRLLSQIGIGFGATCCALLACFRWQLRRKREQE